MSVIAKKLCYWSYANIRALFWIGDVRCGSNGSPAGGPTGRSAVVVRGKTGVGGFS